MRLWMDVMRHLEPVVEDHQRLFDAWEAGGVDGIVVGPLAFADKSYTFDPNPEVYARFGLEPPRPDGTSLWWRAPGPVPTPSGVTRSRSLDPGGGPSGSTHYTRWRERLGLSAGFRWWR